ncbi:translation elongation factor Ts [Mycoplasma iguanae]|uniref:Elongation factor Ts n=1 Tax=Mycoplasma iguanae TaxID=292461 RepID=A0ABY5R7Q9_9MOLU|nr:translation elongation factor Ts [Mycoplasma iguanae]UVD81494.1 translation elongation factor Ts [Mycoplasma iguanae]
MSQPNTMALIKELRERTNAAMIDCKKALESSQWDIEKAIVWLQENGKAKAAKKAGRIAAEGLVNAMANDQAAVIYEVNSETDFVAQNQGFLDLVDEIGKTLLAHDFSNSEQALQLKNSAGKTLEELTIDATATIGEKISLRRAQRINLSDTQVAGSYKHSNGQIATLVLIEGKDAEAARGVAMHVAAMNPEYALVADVPTEKIASLRKEFLADPALAGKPEKIQQNIVEGKINKALAETVLELQDFVVDNAFKVNKFLESKNSKLVSIVRFEVGEGIEKVANDFASEVAAQVSEALK